MPLPVLTLPVPPTQGSYQKQIQYRVRMASFGDGYEQRIADGINTQQQQLQLSCDNITESERNTLVAFFEARGGTEAFTYTSIGDATAKVYTCIGYSETVISGSLYSVAFTLKRVYDYA